MPGTILLTGPNGGIGVGFVTQLLKSPYATPREAIYAVRDPTKALPLKAALKSAPKDHKYLILPVDLASLSSTRAFASDVNTRIASGSLPPIQALILNAGVQDAVKEYFTHDGMERTFQVNYLSIFLLKLLVLQSMDKQHGRIIYIGTTFADPDWGLNSKAYTSEDQKKTIITSVDNMSKGIEEFPDLKEDVEKRDLRRYALTKLLLGAWMYEPQRHLNASPSLSDISVLGDDPGWIGGTDITRSGTLFVNKVFTIVWFIGHVNSIFKSNPLIRTVGENGDDLLRVCSDVKAFGEYPKGMYINGSVLRHTPKEGQDEVMQGRLWKESLVCTGVKEGDTGLENWQ